MRLRKAGIFALTGLLLGATSGPVLPVLADENDDLAVPRSVVAERSKAAKADSPKSSKADSPKSGKADSLKSSKAENSKSGKADGPKSGKAEKPESSKADSPKSSKADSPKSSKADSPKSGKADSSKSNNVESPESNKADSPKSTASEDTGSEAANSQMSLPAAGALETTDSSSATKDPAKAQPGTSKIASPAQMFARWQAKRAAAAGSKQTVVPAAGDVGKSPALPGLAPAPKLNEGSTADSHSQQNLLSDPAVRAGSPRSQGVEPNAGSTAGSVNAGKVVGVTTQASSAAIKTGPVEVPLAAIYRGGQPVAQEMVLPNGLKVLILENHEFPVVSTLVWYRVGSRDEQAGATGLSHMVEHLMFQEVGQFKSGEIGSMIARVGGQFNGYTSDDFTTFFETLPANKIEMALKIESDRMLHTKFSPTEVRQEVANIYKEFENEAKDPQALLSREIRGALFTQHPYHNVTLGKRSDIDTLTADHAKAFYEKYFHPSNATLIISGDVSAKHVVSLVHKYFATASASKPVAHPAVSEPAQHAERRISSKYAGNKELLQVAYHAPAMDDADAPAMVVLERILNGGTAGKLKTKLVDGKICAAAQASFDIKKEPGIFSITCTAIPATVNAQSKIQEGVDSIISQLRDKPLSDAELRRARNQAEFSYFAECDGPYRAGFHLGYFDCLDKWQQSYTWADRIRAVSAADLNRVAKKYLSPETRVVGWMAGTQAAKPTPRADNPPKDHAIGKTIEHTRLNAYKQNDSDVEPDKSAKAKAIAKEKANARAEAIAKANEEKEMAKKKASGIPAVIHDIPSAVGNVVTGNIPGAVGNVGSAIINLPGVLGNIGTAVGTTATTIGKQIVQHPSAESEHISHHVLKNGINLIVFQSHISPVVQIAGSIQAGDAYSPRNKTGYSLLASCLLNQGSVDHDRSKMIALQDDLGIAPAQMLHFDSNVETIDFSTRCLSRDLQAQLNTVAETLSKPDLLDDGTIEKAQQDALSQLKRTEDSIMQKTDRVMLSGLLDENSPFCPPDPSDRVKAISQADLAQTQKFFQTHVVPGATTIVVAGDCNPSHIVEMAEKAFADWDGKDSHAQMHAKVRAQKILRSTVPIKDSKKTSICFGQIVPIAQNHPDYGSLLVADSILVNHPMFSRFEKALSKTPALENAIANGDMSLKLEPVSNLTRWSLSIAVDPSAVPLSIKTIKNEFNQISRSGVTAEEFAEVKRYLLGSLPVRTQATLGSISNSLLDSAEHSDTINGYAAEIASIKNATIESVNKVIRNTFKPSESTVVIAGGAQSIRAGRNRNTAESLDNNDAKSDASTPLGAPASSRAHESTDTKTQENAASDSKVKQQD